MVSINPPADIQAAKPHPQAKRRELLRGLVAIASSIADAQLESLAARLSDALLKLSEQSADAKEVSVSFNAANLLKKNAYAFQYTASDCLKRALQHEVDSIGLPTVPRRRYNDDALTLVSYDEMEKRLSITNAGRFIELEHADRLEALGIRIAYLLERDEIPAAQNPFRPEVFLAAINDAWCEFNPDEASHPLVLPLMRPDVFLDFSAIVQGLNDALISNGILSELGDSYRIKKSNAGHDPDKKPEPGDAAILQQLKQLFSPGQPVSGAQDGPVAELFPVTMQNRVLQATAASNQLLGYLAGVQKSISDHHAANDHSGAAPRESFLPNIKKQAPHGALTQVDENTIDLLTKIFDVVFRDQHIPSEIKALIGFLQVPLLKAALIDKDFFFKEEHPARRLLELLTKSGADWDHEKGHDDPLFQTIKRSVKRVQHAFDEQVEVFSDVVSDLESYLKAEDAAHADALSAPIAQALHQEKMGQAAKTANHEIALRIGTGEVVAFVETFLENKWISVLTLAYSVKDEKPQAVESAIKTMDDLIWSVKPKITREERKELIAMLPGMLAMLNKWLNLVKLDDAERLQFFAELAECHASIVRAPLEISPQRRLEIAIEVAKQAAERRQQRLAGRQSEPVPDDSADAVQRLERGAWLEIAHDGAAKKVKLAWISPLRSLYIFSTKDKRESFSLPAEELAQSFREHRAKILLSGGLVGRALAEALEDAGANDPVHAAKSA